MNGSGSGGTLASRERAAELAALSVTWPSLTLNPVQLGRLELLLSAGPPGGDRVMRLTVPGEQTGDLVAGGPVALRDTEGVMIAVLSRLEIAPTSAGDTRVSGLIEGVALPHHPDYPGLRHTTASLAAEIRRRGWPGRVDGRWLDGRPTTRQVDRIAKLVAAAGRAVVLVPVGGDDPADAAFHLRIRCVRAALTELPADQVLLALVPLPPGAPPHPEREDVARAYGLTPDPTSFDATELAADAADQARLATLLDAGDPVPADLVPAGVAAELAQAYPPRAERGFTVLFTGLSGSGKSTLATLLVIRLLERGGRDVTLLDGDVVRLNLSKGLGFARADRDANVRRIGFVAARVTAAGGIAVCAPIAPYDETRRQVRAMVQRGGGFVLVHVATPLAVCEARDRKGLYAKARAGLLPEFTGISDPYEEPADADLVVDTSELSVEDALARVLDHLIAAGWVEAG